MALKVGESGKILRVGAGFDMSSNTELTLTFIKPDATTVTKTKSGAEVTLGTVAVTDDDLGALNANEYVEYDIEANFLDQSGSWSVYVKYTNTTPTPDDVYIGETTTFTVDAVP